MLSQLPSVDEVCASVAGSPQLERLILKNTNVSPNALRRMGQCPHLDYLQMSQMSPDIRIFSTLSELKTLKLVNLEGEMPKLEQLSVFRHSSAAIAFVTPKGISIAIIPKQLTVMCKGPADDRNTFQAKLPGWHFDKAVHALTRRSKDYAGYLKACEEALNAMP
jgi:hypothetical protein